MTKNIIGIHEIVIVVIFVLNGFLLIESCKAGNLTPKKPDTSIGEVEWLGTYDFDFKLFKEPLLEYGPYTRWWWPGNDVTKAELQREINIFAENGFAGVEIQPFTRGLNPKAKIEEQNRVYSWDTPEFYENLRFVLEQAIYKGLTVDLNGGSGWPSGGPHISQRDNILNLGYSAINVIGGKKIRVEVPGANLEHRPVAMMGSPVVYAKIDPALAKLQAVIAAKIIKENPNEPVVLDPNSTVNISGKVSNNAINWDAPKGNWKIIAFWSFPAGEIPVLIAKKESGLVVDHFDSIKVIANYEYLFGKRTKLDAYYGKPLRAIFNDSYEFKVDRHYSADFLSLFKQKRGYDITPWLPANMQLGYNNHAERKYFPNQKPSFYFSNEDWRLQYDYDLTVSDLIQKHFFKPTREWLENRGMLHRTQPYGLNMDILEASGNASIPETEQLYSEGSEGFLKLVTSGAHLYNRPVISAECFVYRYRGQMTTPQKIKISVDKAIAAGVNQIIYHGTSYKYMTSDFSKAGWNAWDSPFTPNITYSSNITETNSFWKDIKEINTYIRRVQYAMRAGKPKSDVLIYFPFLGVQSRELMSNPQELLPLGYFKGVEPESVIPAFGAPARNPAESTQWYHKIWNIINTLEAAGITWEFTNDISIQVAQYRQGQIDIRGNTYQALILPYLPFIQKASAQRINELCKNGARLLIVGSVPNKQPSFLDYKSNDIKTMHFLKESANQKNSCQLLDENGILDWVHQIPQKIKFNNEYGFIRQLQREMSDGSRMQFIWNKSSKWQQISLNTDASYKNYYWLNAEEGTIVKNEGEVISYQLPPYSSVIFYASTSKVSEDFLSKPTAVGYNGDELTTISKWDINVGDISLKDSDLFDWRTKEELKFKSEDGIYTASFNIDRKSAQSQYVLDLGTVYYTASVNINGTHAGKRIFSPYELDITSNIREGENQIEIIVTPTQRNYSIGEAIKGNKKYAQYMNLENTLMPEGLLGPVTIKLVNKP